MVSAMNSLYRTGIVSRYTSSRHSNNSTDCFGDMQIKAKCTQYTTVRGTIHHRTDVTVIFTPKERDKQLTLSVHKGPSESFTIKQTTLTTLRNKLVRNCNYSKGGAKFVVRKMEKHAKNAAHTLKKNCISSYKNSLS